MDRILRMVRKKSLLSERASAWLPIALIVAYALVVRAIQAHAGLPYIHNWDEPQTAAHALRIMQTGDFNPHFFHYGSLLIYLDCLADSANYLRLSELPLTNPESLLSVHHISEIDKISAPIDVNHGYYWSISHPSFYLWDRYVTVVLGTLTVVVTAKLAGKVLRRRWAWLPPLLLSILPFHIEHSAYVTTDAPAALMVTIATLAALEFAGSGMLPPFVMSLVFVGFAGATKLNSSLIIVLPALALVFHSLRSQAQPRWWLWLLLILVPPMAFLAVEPYALFDFRTFITDIADEVSAYNAPLPDRVAPGFPHVWQILGQIRDTLGLMVSVVTLLGIVGSVHIWLRNWRFPFLLMFPAVFITYMSTTTAEWHRNFVQIYPILAIFFGLGAQFMEESVIAVALGAKWRRAAAAGSVITLLVVVVLLLPIFYHSTRAAIVTLRTEETRTTAAKEMSRIGNSSDILIAEDLRIHPLDLILLNHKYTVLSMKDIIAKLCSVDDTNYNFILPVTLKYYGIVPQTVEQVEAFGRVNDLLHSLRDQPGVLTIGGDTPTVAPGAPPVDPGVMLLVSPSPQCEASMFTPAPS